jgi:dienelactone hydrolase
MSAKIGRRHWRLRAEPRSSRLGSRVRPAPIVDFWLPGGPAVRLGSRAGTPGPRPWPVVPRHGAARTVVEAQTKLPLLLYFPGWAATTVDNVALLTRLSDAGCAIAAVHYPATAPGSSSPEITRQREELEQPMDFSSAAAFADTIGRAERRVRERAADATAIVDAIASAALEDVDREVLDRLDLGRVAIFGFSLGGAVAAEACVADPRFIAAVNLDGWHFGKALERGVPRPYLFISDDSSPPTARELSSIRPNRYYAAMLDRKNREQLAINLAQHGGHLLRIAGTRHTDFANWQPRLRWRQWLCRRPIAPARVLDIVFHCIYAFFAEHLELGRSPRLEAAAAKYPEARLQSWPRAGGARRSGTDGARVIAGAASVGAAVTNRVP